MGDGVAKKRKRNGVEAVVDASAKPIKSKKAKNPQPEIEPEENDEDQVDDDMSDEGEEQSAEEGPEIGSDAEDAEDGDGDDAADDTVGELPTDGAPILPPTAESELFDQLKLSEKTMKAITEMGFTKMTAIQRTVRTPRSSRNFSDFDMATHQSK